MIVIEVKNFERSLVQFNSASEAQRILAQDIHHYLAFFKDKIIDYDISLSNYGHSHDIVFCAIIILRHRVDTTSQAW